MKNILTLFFLLITLSFYGQNDIISIVKHSNLSVVTSDKINIVYRGLPNPVSIAVNNCKSFIATGNGLYKNQDGTYQIIPGAGLEVIITIEIVLNDNTIKIEQHKFRIKNTPYLSGAINGLVCNQSVILMCKEELKNAEISIDFTKDFLYDMKLNLEQFTVKFSKKEIFVIKGNKFTDEVKNIISKLPLNSIFEIQDLKTDNHSSNVCFKNANPIKIMIIEDKNYEEYKENKN